MATAHLADVATGSNANSYSTSAAYTPSADHLVLAAVTNAKSGTPETPTFSGNGLTWIELATFVYDTSGTNYRITILGADAGASPTNTVGTADFGGVNQTSCNIHVSQIENIDLAGGVAAAIVQSDVSDSGPNSSGTSDLVTLAAFADAANIAFGAFGHEANETHTVGADFTELGNTSSGGPSTSLLTEHKVNDTTVDASWASSAAKGGIALELAVASSGTAHELASVIAGVGTVTPLLTPTRNLAAQIDAVGTVTPALMGAFVLASQIDAIAAVTPALTPTRNLAAQIDALATISPTLSAFKELQAQINAAGTVTGETTLALVLASQVDGIATVVPSLTGAFVFASQIDGVAAVTPSLTASHPLLSQINAVGTISPTLSSFKGLVSQIDAIGTVTPSLVVDAVFASTITAEGMVIPVLFVDTAGGAPEASFVSGYNWLQYAVKKGK